MRNFKMNKKHNLSDITISSDDMSFRSIFSGKSEEFLPQLTKVPISAVMQHKEALEPYSDVELLAELKRRKVIEIERNALMALRRKEASPPRKQRGSPSQQFYNVDKILERRGCKPHEFYRVHWEGYPEQEGTWEPVENLLMSEYLIDMVTAFNIRENFLKTPYLEV